MVIISAMVIAMPIRPTLTMLASRIRFRGGVSVRRGMTCHLSEQTTTLNLGVRSEYRMEWSLDH